MHMDDIMERLRSVPNLPERLKRRDLSQEEADAVADAIGRLMEIVEIADPEEIERARREYAVGSDNNIEIDDDARVSRGDDGVWVSAWVWLRDETEDDEPG